MSSPEKNCEQVEWMIDDLSTERRRRRASERRVDRKFRSQLDNGCNLVIYRLAILKAEKGMHIQDAAAYVLSDWCWQAPAGNLDARCKPVRA